MDMKRFLTGMLAISAVIFLIASAGCEGSDARKDVADAVKEAVGGEVVKKSQAMKDQLDQAVKQEVKRLVKTDDQKKAESSGEGSGEAQEKESDE